jgi:CRISPR type IV-associated DEAD/DEAH-box helicase Csf4
VIATLIIPKLPFGLNRSLSYHARLARSRKQGAMDVMETVIRFKQGLGRLIRLENQPKNRRILVLDGRLRMPEYKGFLGPFMREIESYPRVRSI